MIIEPAPIARPTRRRRVVAVAGAAVPIVLLAVVVGLGVSGAPRASTTPPVVAPQEPLRASPDVADAGPTAAVAAAPPDVVDSLPVRSVQEVLAVPPPPGEIVAIAGVLTFDVALPGCEEATPIRATFCPRATILAERPVAASSSPGDLGPHLHPVAPPGVRLPRQVMPDEAGGTPRQAPVVVLATFDDGVRLERVAWMNGSRWRAPAIDPGLERNPFDDTWWSRRLAAEDALGLTARTGSPVMLVTAWLRPATLRAVDPTAATVLARAKREPVALWYVRALLPGGVGEGAMRRGEVRWIVVDDLTGAVLARGSGSPG